MARWFVDGGKLRRTFGYPRPARAKTPKRHHAGVDLVVEHGAAVYAPQAGDVAKVQTWEGPHTRAVLLEVPGGVWVIGGLDPATLAVTGGEHVAEGEQLGTAGRYPGGGVYVHVEWWAPGTRRSRSWPWGEPNPVGLRDPYPAIDALLAGREPPHDDPTPTNDDRPPPKGAPGETGPAGLLVALGVVAGGAVVAWASWKHSSRSRARPKPR